MRRDYDQQLGLHPHELSPSMDRRQLLRLVSLGVGVAALDGLLQAEQQPLPQPIPDGRDVMASYPQSQEIPARVSVDVLREWPWDMAGVERTQRGLTLQPVERAIHTKTEEYQPNPTYNTAYRFDVRDDFEITTAFHLQPETEFSLYVAGQLPKVYDDFMLPGPGTRIACRDGHMMIETWDGEHMEPKRLLTPIEAGPETSLKLARRKDTWAISINDRVEITSRDSAATFQSGELWLGVAASAPCRVSELNVSSLAGMDMVRQRDLKVQHSYQGLRTALRRSARPDFLIGTAAALNPLLENKDYRGLLVSNFNSITLENAMKPQFIQPKKGVFEFGEADQLVEFAQRHGMDVHGHTLVFARALPKWMAELSTETEADKARIKQVMVDHITSVMKHFPHMKAVDVINEPLDGQDWRGHLWYQAIGEDYIEIALRAAQASSPDVELWINENSTDKDTDWDEGRFQKLLAQMKRLRAKGVRIDGLGFQGHVYEIPRDLMSPHALARRMEELNRAGFKARVSEMDVTTHLEQGSAKEGLRVQYEQFSAIARTCLDAPNCTGLTMWGIGGPYVSTAGIDDQGKLGFSSHLPWDERLKQRPAYAGLHQVLAER